MRNIEKPPNDNSRAPANDNKRGGEGSWIDLNQESGQSRASANTPRRLYNWWCQWYTVDLTFYTECPQSGVWVYVRGPAWVWATVNGQYVTGPIVPWYWGRWIYLQPSKLKCGCNRLRLYVWTCWKPWFYYQMWFPPQTCHYGCNNNFMTYYNRRTCRCECLNRCCPWPWQTRQNNPPLCSCN